MNINRVNTLDHSINTVNSTAQTQNPQPNLISQIFQISLHLAHFLNSNKKRERKTKKNLRLYAVLDFCVRYLKEKNLSDVEKSDLDRLISLLVFKMPCSDELANRCEQIFSSFYQSPHSTSAKSLPNFIYIIQEFKNEKMDTWALEMINLYLLFLRNEEEIASENIFKVLDITKDYLTSFQTSLLPVRQEIYDQFFDRYLAFLALYLKHSFKPESSLREKLEEILQALRDATNNNSDNPDFTQLLLHRAFLTSRPEWISYLDPWEAISCLKMIQNQPDSSESQSHIQLQIIYLWYEHILRGLYAHTNLEVTKDSLTLNPIMDIQNSREELLGNTLREIIKLQTTVKLPFSDHILASCLKASIQLQIAPQRKNGINIFKSALKLIEEVLQEVENNGTPISRTTEEHVLRCKMDWVIHCIFAGESKDYAKALIIVNEWCSLHPSHPLFKIGCEIKECIQSTKETAPVRDAFTPQTISLIERFKQLILSDYQTFFSKSLEFYNQNSIKQTTFSIENDSNIPWTTYKLTIANLILKNNIKNAETELYKIFCQLILVSAYLYNNNYNSSNSRSPAPFSTLQPTNQLIIQFEADNVDIKSLKIFFDPQKLDNYVHQHSSHPALRIFLGQEINSLIDNIELKIKTKNLPYPGAESYENNISTIMFFDRFIECYLIELEKFEGQLNFCNTLLHLHQSLVQTLGRNSLLKEIFLNKEKNKSKKKHSFKYKNHLLSIESAENILRNNFLLSTKFVVSLDDFYKETFDVIKTATPITRKAISSDRTKTHELALFLHNCYRIHYQIVNHLNPSSKELDAIKIETMATGLMYLNSLPTEIENPILTTQFFKKIPNTLAELRQQYQLSEDLSACEIILVCIMKQKSYFLVQEQNIEAALKLHDELSTSPYNSKFKIKPGQLFLLTNIIISDNFKIISSLNFSKLNIETLLFSNFKNVNRSIQIQAHDDFPNPAISTKKEVLETTNNRLKRETEKEEKKMARVSYSPTTTADLTTLVDSTATTALPTAGPIRLINKKAYKILQRIFIQNNEEEKGLWKDRSYRSDTVILRTEALKLIQALGGNYSESRGRGSHSVGHVPKLQNLVSENLPKLELNGIEIGMSDQEEGELLITMTKIVKLKYYQLSQFRDALIQQNINLDTVGPES